MKTTLRPFLFLIVLSLVISLACASSGSTPTALPPTSAPTEVLPTEKPTEIPPTIAPTPTAGPQKFYTEEFDDNFNIDNWDTFSFGDGEDTNLKIEPQNEGLVFDLGDEDLYVYYMYTAQTYDDVSLTMVAENRGANNNNVSLVCRFNPDDFTWYEYSFESGGVWYLYAVDDDGYNTIDNGGSNDLHQGLAVNEYGLKCEGNVITMYINGKELKSFTDNKYSFTEGQVGLNISSLNVLPIIVEVQSFDIAEP